MRAIQVMLFTLVFSWLTAGTCQAFYNPNTGWWLNRDPIGEVGFRLLITSLQPYLIAMSDNDIERLNRTFNEQGGLNLYGLCANNPVGKSDRFGLDFDWDTPGEISSRKGAYGPIYERHPDWFDHPADEGMPCCCKPPATLTVRRTDTVAMWQIRMSVDMRITGCYKDLALIWDTCWRYDSTPWGSESAGAIPDAVNSTSAVFFAYGQVYLTHASIRYLSCENGKWTKKTATAGRTYTRALPGVLRWSYSDSTSY